MATRKEVYRFKRGELYNTSDLPIPSSWYADYFHNKTELEGNNELDKCKRSFTLTVTVKYNKTKKEKQC